MEKKLKKALPEDILQPLEEAHLEILHLAPYDLFKQYFDKDMQSKNSIIHFRFR